MFPASYFATSYFPASYFERAGRAFASGAARWFPGLSRRWRAKHRPRMR